MIRILVIDDEAHVRRLYEDLLTREGFEVISTACPEKALDIVRTQKLDIIVLDIELDGDKDTAFGTSKKDHDLEAIKKLRTHGGSAESEVPIYLNREYLGLLNYNYNIFSAVFCKN